MMDFFATFSKKVVNVLLVFFFCFSLLVTGESGSIRFNLD